MKFDKKIPIFQWILYIQCFETDKFPGKENVKNYLKENPAIRDEIEEKVRDHYGFTKKKAPKEKTEN